MKTACLPRTPGIYLIRNTVNGKFYIGSAKTLRGRLDAHIRVLRRGCHHNSHLQASWVKYGGDVFVVEILENVVGCELLIEREQYYLDELKAVQCGYNMAPAAG